nr:hypothetical protein Itr_chr03CG07660 [Ipomoea trifida]
MHRRPPTRREEKPFRSHLLLRHTCRRNFAEQSRPSLLPVTLPLLAGERNRRSPTAHTSFTARASRLVVVECHRLLSRRRRCCHEQRSFLRITLFFTE